MRENRDETRLVAYVLGDVDASEKAAIEAELAESKEMRAEVEAIRVTVAALQGALAAEGQAELTPSQKASVEEEATRGRGRPWTWLLWPPALATLSTMAVLAGAVALWYLHTPGPAREAFEPSPRVARATQPPAAPLQATPSRRPLSQRPAPRHSPLGVPLPTPTPSPAIAAEPTATPHASPQPAEPNAALAVLPGAPAHADLPVAALLHGRVVDPSGAVVPGAEVTLRHEQSGSMRATVSNATGEYAFPAVPPGSYELTVNLPGFNTLKVADLDVSTGDVAIGDLPLSIAGRAEVVTVVGRTPEIQASSGERSTTHSHSRRHAREPRRRRIKRGPRPVSGSGWVRTRQKPFSAESYDHIEDNPFVLVAQDPRSTFSIDVDTASYSNVRRFLNDRLLPPRDAVRIEELINYFPHADAPPDDVEHPFAVHLDAATCPWAPDHTLVRIALKGREVSSKERPPANLVFLLDVSGSMDEPNKLPLVKDAMRLLVSELRPDDRVAIVVYAGAAGLILPPTPASERSTVLGALDRLKAGGSTQGSAGIRLAYRLARETFVEKGINRVILATDGDFNVGVTNQGDLVRLIKNEAKSGVFLTTLGFGMGNYKDSTLEKLADRGNGSYAYIDTLREARKVLVEQISGTLVTIAKDVKVQLELNPATVKAFRLIGYENRLLAHQDFADDSKDAGEIGAGHSVTALYEIVPAGGEIAVPGVDPLKYQEPAHLRKGAPSNELLTLKLRYKMPHQRKSQLMEVVLQDRVENFPKASTDLRFDAAVASFGMLLRDSPFKGSASYSKSIEWARSALGSDPGGYRSELVSLVEKARDLAGRHGEQDE